MGGLFTILDFRKMTVDELYAKMAECGSPGYYQMAVEELQRRHLCDVGEHVSKLNQSSLRMEKLTKVLTGLTVSLVLLTALLLLKDVFHKKAGSKMAISAEQPQKMPPYTPDKSWVKAARNWGWAGLSSWTDASILRNLSTPEGFRAGFPEYRTWNDDEIRDIAVQTPSLPYRGIPPGFKVVSPDGKIDLTTGLVPKDDWARIGNKNSP